MGTGFSKRKKQARAMQAQFSQMKEEMQNKEVIGTAGNGLVTVVLSGDNKMKSITINPECVDPEDIEGLETLVKAAYNNATAQLEQESTPAGMPDLSAFGL